MPDGFPIFIGITGKREFSDDPLTAAAREREVRRRLSAIFDYIDRRSGDTPKILLTGAAAGADLMAAEEALRPGRNWLVVAALPFEPGLFRQDFTAEQWQAYTRVTGDDRTRVWVLPSLRTPTGEPARAADLERRPDAPEDQRDLRRCHYEQVGLWIADTANILVAVLPTEEGAEKVGGTARIVACRRGGRPDAAAAGVIAASEVLAPRPDLHRPPKGYVWLIDPSEPPACADPPVTVLPPARDDTSWALFYRWPAVFDPAHHRGDTRSSRKRPPSQGEHLRDSQKLLAIARRYARDEATPKRATARPPSAVPGWPDAQDPAECLTSLSTTLRRPTYRAAERYRRVVHGQIGLFLSAVLAFEVFAKFSPHKPHALAVYLALLIGIILIHFWARWSEWQPMAEDRRSIREVLRVQVAWWQSGIHERVDHVYLRGADADLARVREAARNLIVYALLVGEMKTPRPNWRSVFDADHGIRLDPHVQPAESPRDWVGNQLVYFWRRKEQRHTKGEFIETISWYLFGTAACLASLLLLLWPRASHPGDHPGFLSALPDWMSGLAALGAVVGAAGCWWIGGKLHVTFRAKREAAPLSIAVILWAGALLFAAAQFTAAVVEQDGAAWTLVAVLGVAVVGAVYCFRKVVPDPNDVHPAASVFGCAAVILGGLAAQALVAKAGGHPHHAEIAKYMIIVLVVFLPALGGAMRFLSEKLAVEAEALSYRDAHVWFEHARELLAARGTDPADAYVRGVIRRLGLLALGENEAWLKARRQRPLSPIIGG